MLQRFFTPLLLAVVFPKVPFLTDVISLTLSPQGSPVEVHNVPDDWLQLRIWKCLDLQPTNLGEGKGARRPEDVHLC